MHFEINAYEIKIIQWVKRAKRWEQLVIHPQKIKKIKQNSQV